MAFLRFLGNLLLAIILIVLMTAIILIAAAVVLSQSWENVGLGHDVQEGDWVRIEGQPIYYRALGSEGAPAVVLVHGADIEGLQTWNANQGALAKAGLRVIAVDLKGFGHSAREAKPTYTLRSQAGLLARVLSELKVSQATLVGHDRGSAVALQLASEQPRFVTKLVLIAPALDEPSEPLWRPVSQIKYVGRYLERAAVWTISAGGPWWMFARWRSFHDRALVSGDYWEAARQPTHIAGTLDALLAMAASPREKLSTKVLTEVKAPTLVLVGREDTLAFINQSRRASQELPNAKLVVIPEAGHYVHVEQSAQVNRQIAEFAAAGGR